MNASQGRQKISLSMSFQDLIILMSEGNPGAATVLMMLFPVAESLSTILSLDDMNIRGSQIWVAYKDFAGKDMEKFLKAVRDRDPEMVAVVNREVRDRTAVTSGASYTR